MMNNDLQKTIREAEKILKPKGKAVSKANIKFSTEARKIAKKIQAYRELKGTKRLTKSEKMALLDYTPKQVFKAQGLTEKQHARREKSLEKILGHGLTDADKLALRYMTPAMYARKMYGIKSQKKDKKEPTYEELYPGIFTPVALPVIRWWDVPAPIRNDPVERKRGGFLYENSHLLWETPERISLSRIAESAVDGKRMTKLSFLRGVLPAVTNNAIFVDPMGESKLFFVYANEWDKVQELPEDYAETRRYRAKKR